MPMPKIPDRVLPEHPTTRPLERFWPYTDLKEQPSDEELARIQPELREALFGPLNLPFSVSLIFPDFTGAEYERAVTLARASDEYSVSEHDGRRWHRARFFTKDRPMRHSRSLSHRGHRPGQRCADQRSAPAVRA